MSRADTGEQVSAVSRSKGERQRTRPQGAICFETERDGGERVHLAEDIDPSYADSITASDPDARSYEDKLPDDLPLPGEGEEKEDCGEDIPITVCDNCGTTTYAGSTCRRSLCPRCWESWAFHRAVEAVTAIDGTRRKRATESATNPYNHHITVSFRTDTRFDSKTPLDRGFAATKRLLDEIAADTGMIIYHPYRIAKEHRGDVLGHESGNGDLHWRDILGMPADERRGKLVYAPHFHVFAVSPFVQGGAVTEDIEDKTGVVIERIADDDGVSLKDLEALCSAVAYSLTHAGITTDKSDQNRAAYRYFGETSNIDRRESVRSDVDEAMRRVSYGVLGVGFERGECKQEVVVGETDDDGQPLAVRVVDPDIPDDTDDTRGGEAVAMPGFGSGSGSGNPSGFGTGETDTAVSHAHTETVECGGKQLPIWQRSRHIDNDEWRERVGAEAVEAAEAAYDEWRDLGEPDPPDIPDGPPDG